MAATPTHEDKFSFGLWTIGYNGNHPFGGPARPPLDVVEAVTTPASVPAASNATSTPRPPVACASAARRGHC
jgi:hypothetical protein